MEKSDGTALSGGPKQVFFGLRLFRRGLYVHWSYAFGCVNDENRQIEYFLGGNAEWLGGGAFASFFDVRFLSGTGILGHC